MNLEKFLPIGTVVLLKGAENKLMITGFLAVNVEDPNNKIYDYCGCPYPEGVLSSEDTFIFDHDDISQIFHVGFVDEEEKEFKNDVKAALEEAEKIISDSYEKE